MEKFSRIFVCIIISTLLPLNMQHPMNLLFRALFNPEGWIVLQPQFRIASTLVCILITWFLGWNLLYKGGFRLWVFILHAVLTFCWGVVVSIGFYLVI